MLGVGTGESLNEVPATGIEWPPFKVRFARLREAIELMRRLAREERVSYEGEHFSTENATIYNRPEIPVPIYVAASGAVAARLAGRMGDGFICTSGKAPELYRDTLLPAVAQGLQKAGRDADSIEYMIEMKVSFDTDRKRAMDDTRHWAALALSAEEKMGVEDPMEMEKLADALPVERAASRWIVSDDPDEHVERMAETIAWGSRIWYFTHRDRTSGDFWISIPSRCCRGCASATAAPTEGPGRSNHAFGDAAANEIVISAGADGVARKAANRRECPRPGRARDGVRCRARCPAALARSKCGK